MDLNNNFTHTKAKNKEIIDKTGRMFASQQVISPRKELKVKCGICKKSFFRELMKKHMKVSHPGIKKASKKFNDADLKIVALEDGRVTCLTCNKTLSSIDNAKRHYQLLHMRNRKVLNYECKECKRRFSVEEYLNTHIQHMHRS